MNRTGMSNVRAMTVFPAGAGMNRIGTENCGDVRVFPAGAGMNRSNAMPA